MAAGEANTKILPHLTANQIISAVSNTNVIEAQEMIYVCTFYAHLTNGHLRH